MRQFQIRQFEKQTGFTLMEIIVATAIFVTVVSSILALLTFVLQINRRVQSVRQVAQGSRNFTEILSREVRNGRIDYYSANSNCVSTNYADITNQSLALTTVDGVESCIYLTTDGKLNIERRNQSGSPTTEVINPENFTINPNNFRIWVRPTSDPFGGDISNLGVQPMVTIVAEFRIFSGGRDEQIIPYQTTISSDVYNIPHAP